ncbi:MAG: hypothetical protein EOO70_07445, partial [Myxococcaceae bacterium]
ELPVGRVSTLYARIGDSVGLLSGLLALGWVLQASVRGLIARRRSATKAGRTDGQGALSVIE